MLLQNKIIIVAGGAGLIGTSFVDAISKQGAKVVIGDYQINAAKNAIAKHAWHDVTSYPVDITSKKSLIELIESTSDKFGKIDGFVNCAYPRNKTYGAKFEDVSYESFCENVSLHLGGYFLASQQMALFFKKQGFGSIVNLSSIYGVIAPRFDIYKESNMTMPVEYAAIKSALIHLTRYIAKYLKGSGIRINSISPGGVEDENQNESFKIN